MGVDLTREGYLEKVRDATEDISINVVFNNAGYLLLGVCIFPPFPPPFLCVPLYSHGVCVSMLIAVASLFVSLL